MASRRTHHVHSFGEIHTRYPSTHAAPAPGPWPQPATHFAVLIADDGQEGYLPATVSDALSWAWPNPPTPLRLPFRRTRSHCAASPHTPCRAVYAARWYSVSPSCPTGRSTSPARRRIPGTPSRTHSPPPGAGFPTGWNVTAHLTWPQPRYASPPGLPHRTTDRIRPSTRYSACAPPSRSRPRPAISRRPPSPTASGQAPCRPVRVPA